MNRDWHNAPLQGSGRSAYDYGRTDLIDDGQTWGERHPRIVVAAWLAFAVVAAFMVKSW